MSWLSFIKKALHTENYVCENCGKKFNSEHEFLNHYHVINSNPPIQQHQQIPNSDKEDGYLCKDCARVFSTEYELLNHIHRSDDILAIKDPDSKTPVIQKIDNQIDTSFISEKKVKITSPKSELLRYDKFEGKIGYLPKKKD
jgi:protein-arginine kinase activator protein McsA